MAPCLVVGPITGPAGYRRVCPSDVAGQRIKVVARGNDAPHIGSSVDPGESLAKPQSVARGPQIPMVAVIAPAPEPAAASGIDRSAVGRRVRRIRVVLVELVMNLVAESACGQSGRAIVADLLQLSKQ